MKHARRRIIQTMTAGGIVLGVVVLIGTFWGDLWSLDFMQRDCCGSWNPGWRCLYVLSNIIIWASYTSIASLIVWRRHDDVPSRQPPPRSTLVLRIAFFMFILTCGLGHLFDGVLSFWWPLYHAWALWHAVTATASVVATVIVFRYRIYLLRRL